MLVAQEIRALERKHERISAVITAIIVILLMLLSMLWTAYRYQVPPPGEKNYEVLGSIDFGDYKNGNKNINNFEKAVADPTPQPRQVQPAPQPEVEVTDNAPQPIEHITNPAPSPVTIPDPPPTPDPTPDPVPPKVEPAPEPVKDPPKEPVVDPAPTPTNTTPVDEELEFDLNDGTSGSNQGDGGDVGNTGSPDVEVIDPNALYTFGTGTDGGVKGRSWLNPSFPKGYNSQEEGTILFEFVISPTGRVLYVKTVGIATQGELVKIGKERIMKYRFSPLPPNVPQVNQKVRQRMEFKLKG